MNAKLLFVHSLSPLHAGTGQGVGVIDLPIAREVATAIPYRPGTSVKGVLRDACADGAACERVFGPDTDNASAHAGSAHFTDARLLLLPVRSLVGTFAWVTSSLLLRRLLRDAADVPGASPPVQVPFPAGREACLIAREGSLINMPMDGAEKVVLEDLLLTAEKSAQVSAWAAWLGPYLFPDDAYWQSALAARLCIVHDDVLSFLLQTATEVTARIALESDTKTVATGALWYEEALPAETVLVGLVVATEVRSTTDEVFTTVRNLTQNTLQVGGSATVGRGLCRMRLV